MAGALAPNAFAAPYVDVYFSGGNVVEVGSPIQLVIEFNEYDGIAYTGNLSTVTYSPGLVNGASFSTTCAGATVDAVPGVASMSATNVAVAANTSCQIYLQMDVSAPGHYTVNMPANAFTSTAGSWPVAFSVSLTVTPSMEVTNIADSGAGSLREAINNANAYCDTAIRFNIAGPGPHTIAPLSALPPLACSTSIDGFTQPGSIQDDGTTPGATNSDIRIVLDGSSCGSCDGLVAQSNLFVSGLAIGSFTGAGIRAQGPVQLWDNFIGTDAAGIAGHGNTIGVASDPGGYLQINQGNLISGNGTGVLVGSFNSSIAYSMIGGDRNGNPGVANGVGIRIVDGYHDVHNNFIRHNLDRGLVIQPGAAEGTYASNNSIWGNGGTGIDVGDDGYTPPNEISSGSYPFYPFNPPFLTSVTYSGGQVSVSGYLKSTPDTDFSVEIYSNTNPSAPGITYGERFVGSIYARTDATGFATVEGSFFIEGTLTNASALALADVCNEGCWSTSEFTPTIDVTAPIDRSVVTNTNDSGPGSLRDAIQFVNFACSPKAARRPAANVRALQGLYSITFNIPGAGPHTIQPLTPLDAVTCDDLMIDAFTQPGSQPNAMSIGDDALRMIVLSGASAPSLTNGLEISGSLVTVRGFIINGFQSGAGILVTTALSRPGPQIAGNVIGTDATGSIRIKNAYGVMNVPGATGMGIGGTSPADRNIISGNDTGIYIQSGDVNIIQYNYIGLNVQGDAAQANDTGVLVSNATNTRIEANVISGNLGNGVSLRSSSGTTMAGNHIGANAQGDNAVPNGSSGIFWAADAFGSVFNNNTIAYNALHGVTVRSTGVTIRGNSIHSNGGLGIELNNGGAPLANDSCDADGGGNNWQNYPVIDSVVVYSDYMTVSGTFDSTAGRTYGLEFFENNGVANPSFNSGRFLLGATTAATTLTPSCATPFSVNLPAVIPPGSLVTATATDLTTGDTSGFSAAVAATLPSAPPNCSILVRSPSTGDGGLIGSGSPVILVPGETANLQALCQADSFAWSDGATTFTTDVPVPGAGASATYSVTAANAAGPATVSVTITGAAAGTPVCSVTPVTPLPLDPTSTSVQVTSTCSPAATSLTWGGFNVLSGQGTPNATIDFSSLVQPAGYGYTVQLSASNAAGQGPTATRIIWFSPVQMSPLSLAFPSTAVGTQSAAQSVTIQNMSNYYANMLNVGVSGPFVVTDNCPRPLPTGSSCTLDFRYAPTAPGASQTGSATLTVPFGPNYVRTVTLTGSAFGAPVVTLTPSSLTFAPRTVLTTSSAQTVTLANTGTTPLNIASLTISGDFAFTSTCGATLAAGASCTLDVTFKPLVAGARSGTLTITDNAAGSPHAVSLSGTGQSTSIPVADVSPTALDFPAQPVGSDSATQSVRVTNSGTAPLTFSSVSVTGEFAIVALTGAANCPLTLAPAASCDIGLVFRPTGFNLREGLLVIQTNAGTVNVRVVGTGFVPAPPQLVVPSSLTFGSQAVGTRSTGRALPIQNTSAILATITELSTTGDFSVSDTCPTIAAGTTCSPLVTFQPTAIGPRAGTLTVRTLRDVAPYTVNLSGTGDENRLPVVELSATTLGFGNAYIGQPVTHDVSIHNIGLAPLVVTGLLADGAFFTDLGCVTTIAPGASCTVHVTFLAGSTGHQSATLEIASNAAGTPHRVGLTGVGCYLPSPVRARFGLLLCGS